MITSSTSDRSSPRARRSPDLRAARTPRAVLALVACAAVLAAMGACASRGPGFRPEHVPPAESVIYVYRPRSMLSPGPVGVFVDQRRVASLARNEYVAAIVAPGEHLVRVQRRADATRSIILGPGESAILEAGASLLGGKVSLVRPDERVARERIAATNRAAPPVDDGVVADR